MQEHEKCYAKFAGGKNDEGIGGRLFGANVPPGAKVSGWEAQVLQKVLCFFCFCSLGFFCFFGFGSLGFLCLLFLLFQSLYVSSDAQ